MKLKTLLLALVIVLSTARPYTAFGQSAPNRSTPEPLDLPVGDAYLSPDGLHILLASPDKSGYSLCVYSAAGKQETCGEFLTAPDLWSIRWSPDSQWIAFTENLFLYMREPDIWVMDVQTGKVTDLTDDQLTKLDITKLWASPSLDVEPAWTPDSRQIVFLRYHGEPSATNSDQHDEQADIYRVAPTGGDPVHVGALVYPAGTPPLATYALALSPDGQQIAYNVDAHKDGEAANGLWVADLDGKHARQIIPAYGITDVAFSADGRFVLGLNGQVLAVVKSTWDASSSLVAALDGGSKLPLDSGHPSQWAAWSPSGTSLVYIVAHSKQPEQDGLYVVDAPGKAGKLVYPGEFVPPSNSHKAPTNHNLLDWASNNTVLVGFQGKLMLLSLDSNQSS